MDDVPPVRQARNVHRDPGGRLVVDYELTEPELARGLRNATQFRRQLLLLATLSVPALFVMMLWPQFRWWMIPFVVTLLAFRALRVPTRVARRAFKSERTRVGSLRLDDSGVTASGVFEGKACWAEVAAFDESPESFQIQISRGPVVVIPKRKLSSALADGVAAFRSRAPSPSQGPYWALFLGSLALAVALHLGLSVG